MFKELKERYEKYASDPVFRFSTLIAVIALPISVIVNYYAGMYATQRASNSVTDIILSNIPVFDVDGIFIYGSFLLIVFILSLLILQPKYIPFTLHSLTLFILTRALFISLTHIGPFPSQTALDLGAVSSKFIFGGDLFFSGHTGIPFLMALVFWRERVLRYVFIIWSIVFGITVLMGHLHYSIDVLSAFFITYVIFHVSEKIFKKERRLSLRA
ncbi:MAG: sphingomyelin synthase family protein [Candidatus Pacebacteria bacterium]|jgi:hypothetical protein|nr:sphingomyelin synthase family protein [Candidatus Paceibacterota bacterium]